MVKYFPLILELFFKLITILSKHQRVVKYFSSCTCSFFQTISSCENIFGINPCLDFNFFHYEKLPTFACFLSTCGCGLYETYNVYMIIQKTHRKTTVRFLQQIYKRRLKKLALTKLRRASRCLESVLFALFHSGVTG